MSESQVRDLEGRIGAALPTSYREYLVSATDKFLEDAIDFQFPRSGVVDEILTARDLLQNDDAGRIGILEKSLLHIGGNLFGGYLYLDLSQEGFGKVHYMESYTIKETFPSFDALLLEPREKREE
ncbi:SMI1/KNR4 family protein [Luteolibacter sp. GHJ8]|uniref:SMI1/KNR4 family protein n=1 Tax=Luteolibacter rhizosphaerae TaxID=2989719 RepID=A0ABT3G7F0_9BACT|nr:SMI1/KNR4 family protein [Luteolibacter rhizosphaerae]MCW1915155.1 SMI1/KNR4 family protein [Luteolibacter rhizosphaerae]